MNLLRRNDSVDMAGDRQADRWSWLWLLIGFVLLPFTAWQTVFPLAAWLAPVFLLRFVRTSGRARIALPLIFVACVASLFIAFRGVAMSDPWSLVLGVITTELIRGLMNTLPYAADCLIGRRLGAWGRLLVFPLAFTTVDWLLSLSRVANSSAGSLAYSQFDNLALMQSVSLTGIWGLTFLITWFASIANALWEQQFDLRPVRGKVAAFGGVLLAVLLVGTVRLSWPVPAAQTVVVASITPDPVLAQTYYLGLDLATFTQWTEAERAAARLQIELPLNQMLARSETALRGGAQIVSWSEGAAAVLEEDKQAALERAAALARQYHAYLQMGLGVSTHAKALPFLLNQSILIDPARAVRWTYDKTYPTFPTEAFITPYGTGDLPTVDTPYGRLSTVICNDQHFPALLRQAGQNGVDLILAPSHAVVPFGAMDVTLGTFRAIENGYTLVRPDGNGTSVMADPEGRVLGSQEIGAGNNGILLINLPARRAWTLYSQIGDVFAYLCVVGLIAVAGWAFVRRGQPVPQKRGQARGSTVSAHS